jgi:hypothetical protein
VSIQTPGRGRRFSRAGREGQQHEGSGEAQRQGQEHRQRNQRRLGQGKAERAGHERRGARGGHHHGQGAGEEGAGDAAARRDAAADALHRGSELEDARHVQGDQQHDQGQAGDHDGDCSWKPQPTAAPPARTAISRPGQGQEGGDDADQEGQALQAGLARVVGVSSQAGGLHRQHREDARHQVEDQAADEGEQQGRREAGSAGLARLAAGAPRPEAPAGGSPAVAVTS